MKYIGMDIHKTTTVISWVDEDNCIMRPFSIPTTAEALTDFARSVEGPAKVALEATRNHAFVHDVLAGSGLPVIVSHPKHTEAISSSTKKSDRHDAIALAKLLKADLLTHSYVPPMEVRLLRELIREYMRLTTISIKAKNWIRASLAQEGLTCRFCDIAGPGGKAWLASAALQPVRKQIIIRSLELIDFVQAQLKQIRSEIIARVKDDPQVKLLISIPGVGYLLAAAICAEIGEVSRFSSDRQLASYAGLVTTTRQSGDHIRHGHITKQGSVVLRWALGMSTKHLLRKPGPLKNFYTRLAEKHGKKSARTATARKLACCIFAMLSRESEYDPGMAARHRQEFRLQQSLVSVGKTR